jgi:hypothetical protein
MRAVAARWSRWLLLAAILFGPAANAVSYQIVYVPVTINVAGKPVVIRRPVVRPIAIVSQPLTVATVGAGRVISLPVGIDCGVDCNERFPNGTRVTLQALPEAGSVFEGWSGACSGTADCMLTVNSATTVNATFRRAGSVACGLADAAFCETFDQPSTLQGRAGELNPARWSGARMQPLLPVGRVPIAIAAATLPPCRAGLPTTVFADGDTVICNPTTAIRSSHLLVAAAAQNYGQNSYRIRQPFDFANRTGRIVADAEAFVLNGLIGWVSIDVSEDPSPVPGFTVNGVGNDEGTLPPRNGFQVQLQANCNAPGNVPGVALRLINLSRNYQQTAIQPTQSVCVPTTPGHLNRIEVRVSQRRLEVYLSPYSADGIDFPPLQLLHAVDVDLPFSRGYVHITTHNHASRKYTGDGSYGATHLYDAWIARWDNVGFDGPVIDSTREYEIGNASIPGTVFGDDITPARGIGYPVADAAAGPEQVLRLNGVDPASAVRARLALSFWSVRGLVSRAEESRYVLRYRFNGKAFHDRPFSAEELGLLAAGQLPSATAPVFDVPLSDLVPGVNTLEFVTVGVPQGYVPAVANIDLVLSR